MNQVTVIGIVISIIFGISGFLASGNIIAGVVSLVLPMMYFLLIAPASPHFNTAAEAPAWSIPGTGTSESSERTDRIRKVNHIFFLSSGTL